MNDIEYIFCNQTAPDDCFGYPIVGDVDGDPVVMKDGKRYRVMWKDKFPPEPVYVEVE